MKKLLSFVTQLIALVASKKNLIAALKAEIARLQGIIDSSAAEDKDREAKQAELESLDAEAASKADDLASLLNDEPAVPTVDPATFAVTADATEHVSDLAFREQQAENAGATTAQTGPAGPATGTGEQGAGKSAEEEDEAAVQGLVDDNTKEALLALAEEEGVPANDGQTKTEIAGAIVAARREKNS